MLMLLFLRKQKNIIIGEKSFEIIDLFFAFLSITVVIFMMRIYSCIIWEGKRNFGSAAKLPSRGPSLHAQQEPARMLSCF